MDLRSTIDCVMVFNKVGESGNQPHLLESLKLQSTIIFRYFSFVHELQTWDTGRVHMKLLATLPCLFRDSQFSTVQI